MNMDDFRRNYIDKMQHKTKRCLDPDRHLKWGVDLQGWTREAMGDREFEETLTGARDWCEAACEKLYTVHPIREGWQLKGRRFEFENQSDAAKFRNFLGLNRRSS